MLPGPHGCSGRQPLRVTVTSPWSLALGLPGGLRAGWAAGGCTWPARAPISTTQSRPGPRPRSPWDRDAFLSLSLPLVFPESETTTGIGALKAKAQIQVEKTHEHH